MDTITISQLEYDALKDRLAATLKELRLANYELEDYTRLKHDLATAEKHIKELSKEIADMDNYIQDILDSVSARARKMNIIGWDSAVEQLLY